MACKRPLGDTLHYMPFLQSILGVGFFYQGRILEELFSNAKVRTVPDYKARFVINILAEYFRIFSNNKTSNITASWRSSLKKCYFAYQKRFYMIWDLLCLKKYQLYTSQRPAKRPAKVLEQNDARLNDHGVFIHGFPQGIPGETCQQTSQRTVVGCFLGCFLHLLIWRRISVFLICTGRN